MAKRKSKHIKTIEVTRWDRFQSRDKEVSPFQRFHHWIAKQFGGPLENHRINVSATCVSLWDQKKLERYTLAWMKRFHRIPARKASYEYGMLNLAVGPVVDCDLKPGVVEVDTRELFTKKMSPESI